MACAGLLTVCLIRPPAPEPPRPPAPAPAAGPAGHALFQDVSGEPAGGAGAVALGVVILPRGRSRSLWTASHCLFLPSLILIFPVPMSMCLPPGLLGSLPRPLGLSRFLSCSLFPCVSLIFISLPLCPVFWLSLFSLLISPCLWFSATAPAAPPTPNHPMYVSGRVGAVNSWSREWPRCPSLAAPGWTDQARGPGRGSSPPPLTPDLVLTRTPSDPTQGLWDPRVGWRCPHSPFVVCTPSPCLAGGPAAPMSTYLELPGLAWVTHLHPFPTFHPCAQPVLFLLRPHSQRSLSGGKGCSPAPSPLSLVTQHLGQSPLSWKGPDPSISQMEKPRPGGLGMCSSSHMEAGVH